MDIIFLFLCTEWNLTKPVGTSKVFRGR